MPLLLGPVDQMLLEEEAWSWVGKTAQGKRCEIIKLCSWVWIFSGLFSFGLDLFVDETLLRAL